MKMHVPREISERIKMDDNDEELLHHIINMRLGPEAINVTYKKTDTQKNEAFNRSLNKYNPKNVTCIKTWRGRVHAAVLNINTGFAEATEQLLKANCHHISEKIKDKILKTSKNKIIQAEAKKTACARTKRALRRVTLISDWERKHRNKQPAVYKTGCDIEVLQQPGPRSVCTCLVYYYS